MAYDKAALMEQLSGLTIMELSDLIEGLKEQWGVTAVVAAAGPAAGGAAPAAEEKTEFDVVLVDAGASTIAAACAAAHAMSATSHGVAVVSPPAPAPPSPAISEMSAHVAVYSA